MKQVTEIVLAQARYFSGANDVTRESRIFADLNITGADFVEFFEKIDKSFSVDTRTITERREHESQKIVPIDVTIEEVIEFILSSRHP